MNIGIDIRCLMHPIKTGVGEYTFELLNSLFNIDKTNQYFLFYNSANDVSASIPQWKGDNIHYITTKYPNKLFNLAIKLGLIKLDKLILKKYPEIKKLDYWFAPNLNFTALTKNTKLIITIHDLSFEIFPEFFTLKRLWWHKIIEPRQQCKKAQIIFTPSFNTKNDLTNFYKTNPEKIHTLYPGLSPTFLNKADDKEKIKQKYQLPDNFILFLGTIEPRKNIIGLIHAFEAIYSSLPLPYTLIIAGAPGWKSKKILEKIKESPLKEKIKFLKYIESADKPTLYSLSSIFVYPSFYEGFGFPIIEAMSQGVPVITSNRSSLPEIAKQAAYLINPNNPSEIAGGIKNILTNFKIKNRLVNSGLEKVKEFSWDKTSQNFLKIISSN